MSLYNFSTLLLRHFSTTRWLHDVPVEAVHHLELSSQLLLGQVVQHAGVHQGLHEVAAVLRQTQAGQPVVAHPLVIHVAVGQYLEGGGGDAKPLVPHF